MKRLGILALTLLLVACATSPTGRRQLTLFPDEDMNQLGLAAFTELKEAVPEESDAATRRYVVCIAEAIAAQAADETGVSQWEVRVFRDETPNAFALPGGKIGVHTGLLDVAEDADQLAAVIGHEIGHVIARHGNERMSQAYVAQAGLTLAQAFMKEKDPAQRDQIMGLLGVGTQLGVMLPFSRSHEREADIIGQELMARAGFDPRASVKLWENMVRAGGTSPPEFLSTHPASENRIRELEAHMDHSMALYRAARDAGLRPQCRRP